MIIRSPAVAGTLYEADTQRLLAQVESWLEDGIGKDIPKPPKALIVPHSSFHFSGQTAAKAYRLLEPVYDGIQRVVLLGTSHREKLNGIALPGTDVFRTPLGDVDVDTHAIKQLLDLPSVTELPEAHRLEHSIEVQLPFLQTALENFKLIPMIVGDCDAETIANVLESMWGGDETLIVISTGLSRKLPYQTSVEQDQKSSELIQSFHTGFTYQEACGFSALNGFLNIAKKKCLDSKQLSLTNSAEVNGQHENVRGFGSFAFY
jgi:AmmeMemoRadiSam system protein B